MPNPAEKIQLTPDLQDLSGLTIEPVLTPEVAVPPQMAEINLLSPQKYECIKVYGFRRLLSEEELRNHPLIRLLHDFKHLMYCGNRGDKAAREEKAKKKKGRRFENHYCRISMSYFLTQDPHTYDLSIRFAISTAFMPIWTNFDGTKIRTMTDSEIRETVANFIESYWVEADSLITGGTTMYRIDNDIVVEHDGDETKS